MAGIALETGSGAKRPVDSELNLVPMIDLFVVCVTFLLITAVWSQTARLEANASAPGSTEGPTKVSEPEKTLRVEMVQDDRFVLSWRSGPTVHATTEVPRRPLPVADGKEGQVGYPDLAKEIAAQWAAHGTHQNSDDRLQDRAVIAVHDRAPFSEIVAVIDAIYGAKRKLGDHEIPAFNVTFATQ